MCREHKPTAQILIMQVFLQFYFGSNFTAVYAKAQTTGINFLKIASECSNIKKE